MNHLENNIDKLLKQKHKTFQWLSGELGYSRQGLKNGLSKKTIKYESIENIAKVLNVRLSDILGSDSDYSLMYHFLDDPIVRLSVDRYDKISDKLSYLKDVYVQEVIINIKRKKNPVYPFEIENKPKYVINDLTAIEFLTKADTLIDMPFSRMDSLFQNFFIDQEYFFEAFYYSIFYANYFNINNYLSDGFLKGNEVAKYWKSWNIDKDKITNENWIWKGDL